MVKLAWAGPRLPAKSTPCRAVDSRTALKASTAWEQISVPASATESSSVPLSSLSLPNLRFVSASALHHSRPLTQAAWTS